MNLIRRSLWPSQSYSYTQKMRRSRRSLASSFLALACSFIFLFRASQPFLAIPFMTTIFPPGLDWGDKTLSRTNRLFAYFRSSRPLGETSSTHATARSLYDSEYSFVTCHLDYHSQEYQICHFRNICWDRRHSTFVFFVDPDRLDVTIHGLETMEGTLRKIPLRRAPNLQIYQNEYLPLEERTTPLPFQNMNLSEHAVHILFSTNIWANNFGHALADDISPLFALMHVFKLVTRDAMILSLHGPAVHQKKAESFLQELTALLSDAGIHTMDSHELFSRPLENKGKHKHTSSSLTCMRNLLVGSGNIENLSLHANVVGAWTPFIDTLLGGWRRGALLKTPEEVSRFVALQLQRQQQQQSIPQHLILFLVKVGRRAITNLDVLARETEKVFTNVEVLLVNPGNMTLHDQIALAQSATVTFGPCGGTSFFNAFLKEGATAIITDYWNVRHNATASMEGYFWNHVTRQQTVRYPVFKHEIVPETSIMEDPDDEQKAYRDYGVLTLNIDRALHLIGHALYSGERAFNMKANSFPRTE